MKDSVLLSLVPFPVAKILDSADVGYFHHCRKFHKKASVENVYLSHTSSRTLGLVPMH